MCGRFARFSPAHVFRLLFRLEEFTNLPPQYNISPGQNIYAVRGIVLRQERTPNENSLERIQKEVVPLQWGLVPFWTKEPTLGPINARAETLTQKPYFKTAFKRHRCLIPVDGFYEWQKTPGGSKQPYFIRMANAKPFALAGIWDRWEGPNSRIIESCAIITTKPNKLLKTIHNRMPAIIPPSAFDTWLDPSPESQERALALLKPFEAQKLEAYPVGDYVNNTKNEGEQCILPKSDRYKQQKLF